MFVDVVIGAQSMDKLIANLSDTLVLEERQSGVNAEEILVEQPIGKLAELVVSALTVLKL